MNMANRNTPAANEQEKKTNTPEESVVKAQNIQEQIQENVQRRLPFMILHPL